MPDIRILKALKMTPTEWGLVPTTGNERELLRAKAWAIINGTAPPIDTATESLDIRERAIEQARKEDNLSRSGFEMAMVQQAQFFGEAVFSIRENIKALQERVAALEALTTPKLAPSEKSPAE